MGEIQKYSDHTFESIKRTDEYGNEYWEARDFQAVLEYTEWRNFEKVIEKAKTACQNSGNKVDDHFVDVNKMVDLGSGAQREVDNYYLSRYACYLIVQNSDPRKEVVALGQTYFAVQTRRQEMTDQIAQQNKGYQGLYGGLGAKEIHGRKGLKKRQNILDHMGSTELAANLFRATQTDDKLRRERITGKEKANQTHFAVGAKVRRTIEELGGTMPEDLPVPEKDVKKIETEQRKQLKAGDEE